MSNILTLDLETRALAQDVGGWPALTRGEGGISCLCMWSSQTQRPHFFDDHTIEQAAEMINKADAILSFNGVNFDIPVIEGILGEKVTPNHHLDLLQLVWEAIPGKAKGYTLEELGQRTIGMGKSGDGTYAPKLAEDGQWAKLFDYCLGDVVLTRKLFQHAQEHNSVVSMAGNPLPLTLPEWFSEAEI